MLHLGYQILASLKVQREEMLINLPFTSHYLPVCASLAQLTRKILTIAHHIDFLNTCVCVCLYLFIDTDILSKK